MEGTGDASIEGTHWSGPQLGLFGGTRVIMKVRRLASFSAASALIIGLLGQSASMVLATGANTQYWTGNGTSNGEINNIVCDENNTPSQLWIWTGTGTNVQISVDGEVVDGDPQGNGSYHFVTSWHDIGDLTTGAGGNVFVTYDGAVDGNAVLTLSHGCEGVTTTTTTTTAATTTTTTTAATTTTTTTTAATTTTTSFSQTVSATTDKKTLPNTAMAEVGGPSNPSSSVWLLIVALGLVLGSVVILTPARAKTKR